MIKDQARVGANILIALVVTAIVVSTFVVMQIRFGGPIFQKYALQDELVADILPPPEYMVEPYLEASLLLIQPDKLGEKTAYLAQMRKDYEARKVYWATAPLPRDQRDVLTQCETFSDQFWKTIEDSYLPALRAGRLDEARRIHDTILSQDYASQHQAVLRLVALSNEFKSREQSGDAITVEVALGVVALLALLVVMAMWLARRRIESHIVTPLGETAQDMRLMAAGHYDGDIKGLERRDEIGIMAQAMAVFRDAGIARLKAEQDQRQVVTELTTGLARLADKDLEYRIHDAFAPDYDSLRLDYNRALDSLMEAIGSVRVGATALMRSIDEIRVGSEDLARRNEIQAGSLEETAASLSEVAQTVEGSAANAVALRTTAQQAHQEATQGGEVVSRAISAMASIAQSSSQISQIINVIDGIAFQTNLLALNAGVEAARAGDAGKGFAVVASEVRALAQRSADAARDIKELISNSTAQVSSGVKLVDETGDRLGGIVDQVGKIAGLIEEIASSSERQAVSVQHVNAAVGDMDRMTQQNAAMVEQSHAATRSLSEEATRLSELMSAFRSRNRMLRPDYVSNPETMRRQTAVERGASMPAAAPKAREQSSTPPRSIARPAQTSGNLALSADNEEWSDF
ncbi:MAG: HAMP domain-containing protein [Sphingomonadales bacterium]|nr:HAMP domain-containing protein [Sphingomonadales bacterium]MDE2167919.1 HAMP domain-containing protein [Sphingomonadales bacterium]